jgi:hypothetical protein
VDAIRGDLRGGEEGRRGERTEMEIDRGIGSLSLHGGVRNFNKR